MLSNSDRKMTEHQSLNSGWKLWLRCIMDIFSTLTNLMLLNTHLRCCNITCRWECVILSVTILFPLSGLHIGMNRFAACETSLWWNGIVSDDNISTANWLEFKELVDLRGKTSFFAPNPSFLTQSEISDIIFTLYITSLQKRWAG